MVSISVVCREEGSGLAMKGNSELVDFVDKS